MYVYMFTYILIYMFTYICIDVHIYINIHVHIYINIHVHICINIHVHICMFTSHLAPIGIKSNHSSSVLMTTALMNSSFCSLLEKQKYLGQTDSCWKHVATLCRSSSSWPHSRNIPWSYGRISRYQASFDCCRWCNTSSEAMITITFDLIASSLISRPIFSTFTVRIDRLLRVSNSCCSYFAHNSPIGAYSKATSCPAYKYSSV